MASPSPSPSTSYEIGNKYYRFDVFLNHRGPDVKKGLATKLYRSLCAHGLSVFLDCEELQAGDNLDPQIEGAIKTASLHIAVFSPHYAESPWCLDELVKMLDSKKYILPIFYNVHPSVLRWTKGGDGAYAQSLRGLALKKASDSQPRHESHTIEKWRDALSVVSNISGFELNACNGDEGLLVQKVVQEVLRKLRKTPLNVAKYPTGLDDKVEDFETTMLSQQQSEKTTAVGIVGYGGVGKTTLAKKLFNRHRSKYDRSCFLSDVRENAAKGLLNGLQSTLLKELRHFHVVDISSTHEGVEMLKIHLSPSHRVLVVIDDVDHMNQLDALFLPIKDAIHSSSFILVTSRDMDLLKRSGIPESYIYKQTGLNREHSEELFCLHAFNHPYPRPGFEQLVKQFLNVCGGLPLSLQVIGALLCSHEDLHYWKAQFKKISKIPPTDILNTLKISYDSLDDEQKQIFLDAACFFIGEDRDTAIRIWDGSCWEGLLGLRSLENKCLLEVDSKNRIRMHDHLRDLGRHIAKKEIPHRLWRRDDIVYDNSPVRGISMVHGTEIPANIRELQLLRAEGKRVKRIFSVPQPPQPVWLRWDSCPYSSLPSWIPVEKLRVLHIKRGVKLETLWQNESQAPLKLRELNIDANLSNVPKSIGMLKHLEKFVSSDIDLETLPHEVGGMHSLKLLKLQSRRLCFLPDSAGNWKNIQGIYLSSCDSLRGLPNSAGNWTKLEVIHLNDCSNMQGLPVSAGNWTNLKNINLYKCCALQRLPDSDWTNLEVIDLRYCFNMQGLPDSVGNWTNLRNINLSYCYALQRLPESAGNWTNLEEIYLKCCRKMRGLPDSAGNWRNLEVIDLRCCDNMQGLPDSTENWTNLRNINLSYWYALQRLPDSAGHWTNLEVIDLRNCYNMQGLPDSAENWTNLRNINLSYCSALQRLPHSAGKWTNLEVIELSECDNMQGLPDSAENWTNLTHINLTGCTALQGLPESAGNWANLKHIDLTGCTALQGLPDSAGNWRNLHFIMLNECSNLGRTGVVVELLARGRTRNI